MEKRELPTRHNFLTESIKNLLEPKTTHTEPLINGKSIITVTSNNKTLKKYHYHAPSVPDQPCLIEHTPQVRLIEPIARKKQLNNEVIPDEYYLKRHRKHEMDEKKQKNREKERLKHGYYQQKQLVERIKTLDKSLLQSIVSSIRHRTHQKENMLEEELDELHHRLLVEALEHLRRYEVLGLCNQKDAQIEDTLIHKPLETKKTHSIKSFSNHTDTGSRRSTRRILAFGQKLPDFEPQEFHLPDDILQKK
ncbi:uncharacterized protein B0P05DRAFT_232111, partial [Gilbertella persicaria]|uniref:Something about silencing protein 4 domain-containing protein n=1 Tax=Rhizopus stolonifer TaxID=4846 RepID=A0A367KQQ6_RHIST